MLAGLFCYFSFALNLKTFPRERHNLKQTFYVFPTNTVIIVLLNETLEL